MNRLKWLAYFLLMPFLAQSQADITDSMNTERFWKTIAFSDYKDVVPAAKPDADTLMVVVSNRVPKLDDVRFMTEERNTDGRLNYFLVFLKNDKWHVWRQTNLATAISQLPANNDWVVYTEGFGKIFTTGLYRGLSMTVQHSVNVLYLDYPSFSTSKKTLGNYTFALDNAKQAGNDFLPILQQVKGMKEAGMLGNGRLSLFFHSMGNNAIRELVREDKLTALNKDVWVDNLILNSACVPERKHAEWVDKISFAKRVYINYNPKDFTLGGAKLMSLSRQLGEGSRGTMSKQATYVNFNMLCGPNHSNFVRLVSHYKAPDMALAYYRILFHGKRVNVRDEKVFITSTYRKLGYSIYCKNNTVTTDQPATTNKSTTQETADEQGATQSSGSSMSLH